MKSIICKLAIVLTMLIIAWDTKAQEIVGYSDLFTFDTRFTNVQGTISDAGNGNPLAGVLVNLTGVGDTYSASSQADGTYSLGVVPTGNYMLSLLKLGYEEYSQNIFVTGAPSQTVDVSLTPGSSTYVMVNDSIAAFGDNIVEDPPNVYNLSGNVNINNVLYFDGDIKIDKRSYLEYPEISGACGFFAKNIDNYETYWIKHNNIQFVYYAQDKRMIPSQWAYILDGSFMIGGFNITIGEIIVDPGFDFIEIKSIAQMPFPINKVMEHLQALHAEQLPLFVEQISGSRILSRTTGVQTVVDISGIGVNIGIVQLENVNLYYNNNTETYGGGFTLNIPGSAGNKRSDSDSTLTDSETGRIPVEIRDVNEQPVDSMSFDEFIDIYRARSFVLVSVGAQIEFVHGAINKIIVTIGTKIPLGTTGLFLTEITGGLDDLATENWKIIANVDIELGYEVPVLGSPVKFDNFGVLIQPWNAFRGSGAFQVFNTTISEGYIEYNRPLSSLSAECKVNMYWGILKGRTYLGLVGGHVSGSGSLSVNTPPKSELPWFLKWAGNKRIGSATASFNNKVFQSSVHLSFIKFAQRLSFGKTSFPWFHYYLGRNMDHLHKIWKGERDGMQVVTFNVPENSKQLLVVAMDTLNPTLFDFTLEDPSGLIYDKNNVYYYEANDSVQQTIMSVLDPIAGEWDFLADYDGQFDVEISITNQESTVLLELPGERRTRSNQISLTINDFADTMDVQVYYDISNQHFNGTMIDSCRIINNGTLDFLWQNQDVPNGEYYIYCRVDDGYNEPYLQYAPGSIWVENDPGIETPQNFTVAQENNGFLVNWDDAVSESIIATTAYYKNISSGRIAEETVFDSTSLIITDLEPGQEYQIWACFIDENDNFSEPGEKINIIFTTGNRNNPPYFTLDPDSLFSFVEGQQKMYKMTANDADEDELTFSIPDNTLGITIFYDNMIWKPSEGDRGVYDLMITVTDGSYTDTTFQQLIVYTPQQVSVDLAFNSLNLYENDNMFVKINNYSCPESYQQVTLKNLRTQEETSIETRRVNEFEYLGQFGLSFINRTDISVKNGDTIEAKYIYLNEEYFAYSCYDSLPQPSDIIPPGTINDLSIESLSNNTIKLRWTATGNDTETGKAYRYDIRYDFEPINSEDVYYTADRILVYPYPSIAGEQDSLIINLMDLQGINQNNMIYFSIKAEDEMQNRSGLSNSPGIQISVNPANITAMVQDVYFVFLNWDGPLPGNHKAGLLHYNIFRKIDQGELSLLQTGITQTEYTDNLKFLSDGTYQYAIQAIYDTETSDTVPAPPVLLERFVNVSILLSLPDTSNYQGIVFGMTGFDSIYSQQFSHITDATGLVSLANVFYSGYAVVASKNDYHVLLDTIYVSKNNHSFNLELSPIHPGGIIDNPAIQGQFFKIYPNPNEGIFTMELMDACQTSGLWVEIYDMMGTRVMKIELSGKRLHEFDLSDKPAGIYLLRVIKGDDIGVWKVIRK
jgi:hypothetical protein